MLDKTSHLPSKNGSETKPSRYHPALVTLHWISAVLVLVALSTGTFWLTATPNSSPDKIAQLTMHMTLGIAILVLTVARLAVRIKTPQPERALTGNALLDELASATHHGLYVTIILMAVTGIATAVAADIPAIMLVGSSESLPESFSELPSRIAHGLLAQGLIALILLHTLGALYHHLFRKDQLLRRIWFEQPPRRKSSQQLTVQEGG
jgi:cytochrome b561